MIMFGYSLGINAAHEKLGVGRSVSELIDATLTPATSPLVSGQSVDAVTDYATMVSIANFRTAAPQATIASAIVTPTNDAATTAQALVEGDVAGFTVRVSDTAGNSRTYIASPVTVPHIAPTTNGSIPDASFGQDVAIVPLDMTDHFTGTDLRYTLAPSSGALPEGLELSETGVLSGTPTDLVTARAIVVRATNPGGFVDQGFSLDVVVASAQVLDQTRSFGASDASGHGGAKVFDTAGNVVNLVSFDSLAGGSLGPYTASIVDGFLTFTGAVGAPDGAVLRCSHANGTVDITVDTVPDVFFVRNESEFVALQSNPALSGSEVRLRDIGQENLEAAWKGARIRFVEAASTVTITGERPLTKVWELSFVECSNFTIENLHFVAEWRTAGDENSAMLLFSGNGVGSWNDDITVRNNLFTSNRQDPEGVDAWKKRSGFRITANNSGSQQRVTITDNTFAHTFNGGSVVGGAFVRFSRNTLTNVFQDMFSYTVHPGTSILGFEANDNFFGEQEGLAGRDYGSNGGPNDPHSGKIEVQLSDIDRDVSGVQILRNIAAATNGYYSGNSISIKGRETAENWKLFDLEIAGNIFQQWAGGITVNHANGALVHHNTVVSDYVSTANAPPPMRPFYEPVSVRIQALSGTVNSSFYSNLCETVMQDAEGNNVLENNSTVQAPADPDAALYAEMFTYDFATGTMPEQDKATVIAAYAPNVGGPLDPGAMEDRIGAGWFENYGEFTSAYHVATVGATLDNPIADQAFAVGSEDVTIDLDTVFTGADSYSVSNNAAVSISGSTLTISSDTAVDTTDITVTASKTGADDVTDTFVLEISSVAAGYVQSVFDTQGTAYAQKAATATSDVATVEGSVWFELKSVTGAQRIWDVRNGSRIGFSNDRLELLVEDSAGSIIFSEQTATGTVTVNTPFHLYWWIDAANNAVELRIDDVPVEGFNTSMVTGTGLIGLGLQTGVFASRTGVSLLDTKFGDFWLSYGQAKVGSAALYNGGTPPDLNGVGAPFVHLGGAQTVQDLNAFGNNGSATLSAGSGTFVAG